MNLCAWSCKLRCDERVLNTLSQPKGYWNKFLDSKFNTSFSMSNLGQELWEQWFVLVCLIVLNENGDILFIIVSGGGSSDYLLFKIIIIFFLQNNVNSFSISNLGQELWKPVISFSMFNYNIYWMNLIIWKRMVI